MPCELLAHWDPAQPLLVGGLAAAEEGRGFMQLRLKRHRWFGRVLKNRDPLTFSIGWRRFQSVPVYATEDQNGRHRCDAPAAWPRGPPRRCARAARAARGGCPSAAPARERGEQG
jgi:hypothetical protein